MDDVKQIKSNSKAKTQMIGELVSLSLSEGNFKCFLCDEVFVHPVTLPCRHSICKLCLDKHFYNNGFTCPFCRARVSNWLRKLKLINADLVDTKFWNLIKKTFPLYVEARLTGNTDIQLSPHDSASPCDKPKLNISQPGEIRKEYEEFLIKQKEENSKEEMKNLRLSEDLIKMIEEDEARAKEKELEQLRADEELARLMANESSPPTAVDVVASDTRWTTDDTISTHLNLSQTPVKSPGKSIDNLLRLDLASPSTKVSLHSSTPKPVVGSLLDHSTTDILPIPLDTPSTSKDDIFSKYFIRALPHGVQSDSSHETVSEIPEALVNAVETQPVPSTFSSPELSHFTSVVPRASTSTNVPAEIQSSMSRSSSGSDSIGQELRHFKPIRTSPTTPIKEGSSNWMPQVVVAQRRDATSCEVMQIICGNPDSDISAQDIENAIALEKQIEADRELAAMLQKEFDVAENKRKRSGLSLKTDYNLRNKRKKSNLRKKVLVDRAQATLDSMLIK